MDKSIDFFKDKEQVKQYDVRAISMIERKTSNHGHPVVFFCVSGHTQKKFQFDYDSEADKFVSAMEFLKRTEANVLWLAFNELAESVEGAAFLSKTTLNSAVRQHLQSQDQASKSDTSSSPPASSIAMTEDERELLVMRMLHLTTSHTNTEELSSLDNSMDVNKISTFKKELDNGNMSRIEYTEKMSQYNNPKDKSNTSIDSTAASASSDMDVLGCTFKDFFVFFVFQQSALNISDTVSFDKAYVLNSWIERARKSFDALPGGAAAEHTKLSTGRPLSWKDTSLANLAMLEGEFQLCANPNVRCAVGVLQEMGDAYVTNYRIRFLGYTNQGDASYQSGRFGTANTVRIMEVMHVPLASIILVEYSKSNQTITLSVKDGRRVQLTWISKEARDKDKVAQTLQIIREHVLGKPFAYVYRPAGRSRLGSIIGSEPMNGSIYYKPMNEYDRQGFLDIRFKDSGFSSVVGQSSAQKSFAMKRVWQVWDQRASDYDMSPTYPGQFLLPTAMTDAELSKAAEFRSKRRLPVPVFRHPGNGTLLCRSSQPMVGLKFVVCDQDIKLLDLYRTQGVAPDYRNKNAHEARMVILDCRGRLAAKGNQTMGKGTEDVSNYTNTELDFGCIDNIHAMRSSIKQLHSLVQPSTDNGADFIARLNESGWLNHVRLVLDLAITAVRHIHLNETSVLVHCSDGWDRTTQVVSMAQLLMDPYFRTIDGLIVLIEKEWLSFGHKFSDRCCHASEETQEYSPIFLQWLDCIHQLIDQFPTAFEYTEKLLIFIADHTYSGLYGTFLGNSEKDRAEKSKYGVSIWYHVKKEFQQPNSLMRNTLYNEEHVDPLEPHTGLRLRLWERYFCRWDPAMHPRPEERPNMAPWIDDWGPALMDKVNQQETSGLVPTPTTSGGSLKWWETSPDGARSDGGEGARPVGYGEKPSVLPSDSNEQAKGPTAPPHPYMGTSASKGIRSEGARAGEVPVHGDGTSAMSSPVAESLPEPALSPGKSPMKETDNDSRIRSASVAASSYV